MNAEGISSFQYFKVYPTRSCPWDLGAALGARQQSPLSSLTLSSRDSGVFPAAFFSRAGSHCYFENTSRGTSELDPRCRLSALASRSKAATQVSSKAHAHSQSAAAFVRARATRGRQLGLPCAEAPWALWALSSLSHVKQSRWHQAGAGVAHFRRENAGRGELGARAAKGGGDSPPSGPVSHPIHEATPPLLM